MLNSDLVITSGATEATILITKSWSDATGGFSWTCPKTGYYYLSLNFSITPWVDFLGLQCKSDGIIKFSEKRSGNGDLLLNGLIYITEGQKITPSVWTDSANISITTSLFFTCLVGK